MTNASKFGFVPVLSVVAVAAVLFLGAFATTAHADDYFGSCCGDAGYTDFGYSDAGYTDYGYSNPGYTDYGYSDPGYTDYGYSNPGYTDYGYSDAGYTDYGYSDAGYTDYAPGYTDYSQSPIYYGSDGAMYSTTGGGSYYSSGGGYSIPRQNQPIFSIVPIGQPTKQSQGSSQTQTQAQSQSSTNTNNNSNVNNNTSNSVSSVSNSGNSTNNINVVVNVPAQQAPVTPIYTLPTVQYPVQFVQPIQTPAPYCTITITNNSGYGYNNVYNQATLTWSASNATSAYISPSIGTVSTYGTRIVNPIGNQVYTMTVYGQNGQTANCQTTFYGTTYVPPVQTPYVSLSQIPYTGFDLGTTGTAIYWASLVAFALAAAYLMIYFRGGALALAGNVFSSKGHVAEVAEVKVAPVAPVKETPAMSFDLPVTSSRHVTTDTMTLTPDGRLVISRN